MSMTSLLEGKRTSNHLYNLLNYFVNFDMRLAYLIVAYRDDMAFNILANTDSDNGLSFVKRHAYMGP